MVYNVEKMLKEHRDKIGEADAKDVEDGARGDEEGDARTAAWNEINAAHRQADAGQPQAGRGDVQGRRRAAGRRAAADGAGRRRGGRGAGAEKPKDDVVDAEFVDVDDKK